MAPDRRQNMGLQENIEVIQTNECTATVHRYHVPENSMAHHVSRLLSECPHPGISADMSSLWVCEKRTNADERMPVLL